MSKISRIVLNTVLNCRVAVFGICKNRKKSKTVKSAIVAGALSGRVFNKLMAIKRNIPVQ